MSFINFCNDLDKNKKDLFEQIDKSKKTIDKLLSIENKNYNNFIKAFFDSYYKADIPMTMIGHLDSVLNSKESQKVFEEILPIIEEYEISMDTNKDIYKAFLYIRDSDKSIDKVQKKVLDDSIKNFELSGVGLDDKDKEKLKEISIKTSQLSKDFSQNLLDANNKYELLIQDYEDVKELPKVDLEQSKIIKDGKTYYKFTLQAPSYLAYMTYGSSSAYREELYKAYTTRAPQNAKLIDEILLLREKLAKLLGFDNFASMSISSKDAPNVESVEDFLEQIASKTKDVAKKELRELEEFANTKINAFDMPYYSEKMKKKYHNIDEEEYMNYFELDNVVKYVLKFLQNSFDVDIKQVNNAITWDDKVKVYDFYENNKCFARLYLDLENRENKKGGAWMENFQDHCIDSENKEQLACAFIVCNFMPSSSKNPSLLKHNDIVTLFHELGHGIHHIFSKVNEQSLSGVNGVAWDVVEFPSQFLEEFAFDKKVLKDIGTHYKTKEKISDDMINRLIDAKNFQSALGMIRQCEFAIFDILVHKKLHQGEQIQGLLDTIRQKYSALIPPKYNKFQNGFSHIFSGGYASGYYSYKYAEVLSADLYIKNTKKSILKQYKEHILSKGASENMGVLFETITNEKPNIESLFELYGLRNK